MAFLVLLSFALAPAPIATAEQLDKSKILENVRLLESSRESVEFTCDELRLNDSGNIAEGISFARYKFWAASGGRRALIATTVYPDGRYEVLHNFREDGRVRCDILTFKDEPKSIKSINIKNQTNTELSYTGMMFSAMWLLNPGGVPLHSLLNGPATLEEAGEDGKRVIVLNAVHPKKGGRLLCMLDSEHDWLPREVVRGLPPKGLSWKVDKFQRDNGRWFPSEGRFTAHTPDKPIDLRFRITNLKINRPIPPSVFTVPAITEGVMVQDDRTGESFFQGGPRAQKALYDRHGMTRKKPALQAKSEERSAARRPLKIGILAGVAAALMAGVILVLRRRARV